MSDEIEASANYYQLLASKHQASGRGPNQARVYGELVALVRQCSTLDEIQSRMKAGGYYESPAQALMLDKLLAHRDAATELGFLALAQIYQQRYDAVAADYSAAWSTGWEQQVAQEQNRIAVVADALNQLIGGYYQFRCSHALAQADPLAKMRSAITTMQAQGENPEAVVNSPYYRRHCPLSDAQYQAALSMIRQLLVSDPDTTAQHADWQARTETVVESGDQELLKQRRQQNEARQRRSVNLCIAPDDAPGDYLYESFYEGKL